MEEIFIGLLEIALLWLSPESVGVPVYEKKAHVIRCQRVPLRQDNLYNYKSGRGVLKSNLKRTVDLRFQIELALGSYSKKNTGEKRYI